MSLKAEKQSDAAQILGEIGEPVTWKHETFSALITAPVIAQEFAIGGIVETADFTVKAARSAFPHERPEHGDILNFDGRDYRIVRMSDHPGYPFLVFYVTAKDE